MTVDPFTERLARVRHRFVSTLEGKIEQTRASIPVLAATVPDAASAVAEAYRCIHGIVGVGSIVGFPNTGQAARGVEDVLRPPYRSRRGLTADEVSVLKASLQALRDAASRELHSLHSIGGPR